MNTPVAFIIFNRPDRTRQVFAEIRKARPSQLLVIADGARSAEDIEKCAQTRSIIDLVDWDCEVMTNYSDVNLGCKQRVSSGLDWVFATVEEAIVLEDDCLPHPTFFKYCEELLYKYRHDRRIMAISGDNFDFGRQRTSDSYYFSKYNYIWGWASWRRAWQHYDVEMRSWSGIRDKNWLKNLLGDDAAARIWQERLQNVYEEKIDTWDYQWVLSCWLQNGLTIIPNVNLIGNLGFGTDATHTTDSEHKLANLPIEAMPLPLRHPQQVICDVEFDRYASRNNIHI